MKIFIHRTIYLAIVAITSLSTEAQNFAQREIISGPSYNYQSPVIIDADKDGDTDVVNFPFIHLNNGQAELEKSVLLSTEHTEIYEFHVLDFDGDGLKDIIAYYESGKLEFYFGTKTWFEQRWKNNELNIRGEYSDLFFLDLNLDGFMDILTTSLDVRGTALLGDGQGKFQYLSYISEIGNCRNPILTDLNNDGNIDLVMEGKQSDAYSAQGLSIWLAYNYVDGRFQVFDSLKLEGRSLTSYLFFDMDQDGDEDMVYYSKYADKIYWIEKGKTGKFSTNYQLGQSMEVDHLSLADFDSDGDLDILYSNTGYHNRIWKLALNKGDNTFKYEAEPAHKHILKRKLLADMNGDGTLDFVIDSDVENDGTRFIVVTMDKNAEILDEKEWFYYGSCSQFGYLDIDIDGIQDIVGRSSNRLFWHSVSSKGIISEEKQLFTSPYKLGNFLIGDLNTDGIDDLLLVPDDNAQTSMAWFKNEGNGTFSEQSKVHSGEGRLKEVACLDYDGDGDLDIIVNYWLDNSYGFYTYDNLGNGEFSKEMKLVSESSTFNELQLLDADGDGEKEITDLDHHVYHEFDGTTFTTDSMVFRGRFIALIEPANIDGDKSNDYLCLSFKEGLLWYEQNPGAWKDSALVPRSFEVEWFVVVDMDNDGDDDIVCLVEHTVMGFEDEMTFHDEYNIFYLENTGKGFKQHEVFPHEFDTITDMNVCDIDQDGDLDILCSGYHDPFGGISLFKNLKN